MDILKQLSEDKLTKTPKSIETGNYGVYVPDRKSQTAIMN